MDFTRYVLIVMACWFGVSLLAGTILGRFVDGPALDALGGIAALGGIVLVLSGAAASVVLVLLFNLISDLTGGVRVTVLEEEPTRPRRDSPTPASRD